ncbi:Sentrin-specific protease 1, partial [Operophtera brumata]
VGFPKTLYITYHDNISNASASEVGFPKTLNITYRDNISNASASEFRFPKTQYITYRDNISNASASEVGFPKTLYITYRDNISNASASEINVQQKRGSKKLPKLYIELDDDDYEESHQNENDDDVQFVKKISAPQPLNPYRYFDSDTSESLYSKMSRKLNDRTSTMSPKSFSKFVAPAGITKPYRKAPPIVSKWLQGPGATKPSNLPRNRFYGQNGNTRATMSEVFNLDEKNNYQELIRKARSMKPATYGRSSDFINLTDEAESFRNTMRLQRKALNEIRFAERGVVTEKKNDLKKEYGPLVIASLNSSDSEVEVVPSETSTSSSSRIEPINTLRDSYRDVAVTSTDWLTRLDSKYKKKRQLTREKLVDAKRESDIISKVNSEQKIAQLEHKLKYELSIPESLYEEPQPTVELPALTPEQEKLVSRALGPGPPGSLIIEKFGLRIHNGARAARTYRECTRPTPSSTPSSCRAGRRACAAGPGSIVDFRAKKISYLDSMGGPNRACLEALLIYLRDEHQDKKGQPFNDKGWKTETLKALLSYLRDEHQDKKGQPFDDKGWKTETLKALLSYLRDEHQHKKGQPFDDKGWKTETLKVLSCTTINRACLEALLSYLRDEHQHKKGQPFKDKGWKTETLKAPIIYNNQPRLHLSYTTINRACLEALLSYLRDEHQHKKGQPFNDKGWKTETLKALLSYLRDEHQHKKGQPFDDKGWKTETLKALLSYLRDEHQHKKGQPFDDKGWKTETLKALLSYLRDEHQDKKGQPFDDKGWKTETLKMNGSDCGMFACTFAEFSARDAPYSFTQAHMPYLRRKMALEIITGQLLL